MTIASAFEQDLSFPGLQLLTRFIDWLRPEPPAEPPPQARPQPAGSACTGSPSPPRKLRPLLIAEGANPSLTSASLVGWSCAIAVAKITDAHIVTEWRNREDFLKAGLIEGKDFTAIDARRSQGLAWLAAKRLSGRGNFSWSLYAAFSNLAYPFFERAVWKAFAPRLRAGEFDVVHRILPLSPTTPSWLAGKLRAIQVPFVIGPLNGGVPWPKGFDEVRRNERDTAGQLRKLYKLLPGNGRTRKHSTAIITAARTTHRNLPAAVHGKCVFIPENAVDTQRFPLQPRAARVPGPLRVAFVGRLVALKGVDMLLEAAAPLARAGQLELDLIGDGPERPRLLQLVEKLQISAQVKLPGWVPHAALQPRLQQSDVLGFPSIREFGGGAVLEAMALGLPPIVLDHGGPPELVPAGTGFVLPLQSRAQIIGDLRALLTQLAADPSCLVEIGRAAQSHVRRYYTWEAKAAQILEVYHWMLGRRHSKPCWGMPMGFTNPADAEPPLAAAPAQQFCDFQYPMASKCAAR
jgi:glycosyltransferase involved in cell wall biosynthesis